MRRRTLTNCWMIRRIWRSTACPQAVASLWQPGQQILNPGTIGMPYFDWEPIQNHRAQYALIDVEEDGWPTCNFVRWPMTMKQSPRCQGQGPSFIEMYEELRREDNYRGHNIDLLTSLIEKYGYAKEVAAYFNFFQWIIGGSLVYSTYKKRGGSSKCPLSFFHNLRL